MDGNSRDEPLRQPRGLGVPLFRGALNLRQRRRADLLELAVGRLPLLDVVGMKSLHERLGIVLEQREEGEEGQRHRHILTGNRPRC